MKVLTALAALQLAFIDAAETGAAETTPRPSDTSKAHNDDSATRKTVDGTAEKSLHAFPPVAAGPRPAELRSPDLVARNRAVRIEFIRGSLTIAADGRALSSGAEGDRVRVLNVGSRAVVTGVVVGGDRVAVQ